MEKSLKESCKNFFELDKFSIKKNHLWESISKNVKLELDISDKKILSIFSENILIFTSHVSNKTCHYYTKSDLVFFKFTREKMQLKFKNLDSLFEFLKLLNLESAVESDTEESQLPLIIASENLKNEDVLKYFHAKKQSADFMEKIKIFKAEPKWDIVIKKVLQIPSTSAIARSKITKRKKFSASKKTCVKNYCYCRKPDDFSLMIECSNEKCKIAWFHAKCVFTDASSLKDLDKKDWYCVNCA